MRITPNMPETMGQTDSASIQNAVNFAKKTGVNRVIIPHTNERTGKPEWDIDKTILLPSDITVILEDAYLRMADGIRCNMFCNENAYSEIGNTDEGTQRNIHIIGFGNSVLDGGEPNGLNEVTARQMNISASANLTIYLHNVENFSLDGFTIKDQRWWAIAVMFARHGRIANLHFRLTRHEIDTFETWRNQDGVDIRIGCSDILIENLEGEVGDDFVALTALRGKLETNGYIEGGDHDIHDITIRNIYAKTNLCAVIRLLNHFGQKIYNIKMENIYDVSRPSLDPRSQMVLRIGDDSDAYYRCKLENRAKLGEMYNITAKNIHSRALCAVNTCVAVKDMTVEDLYVYEGGGYAYVAGYTTLAEPSMLILYHPSRDEEYKNVRIDMLPSHVAEMENIHLKNVVYKSDGKDAPAVIGVWNTNIKNVTVENLQNSSELPTIAYFEEGNVRTTQSTDQKFEL